MAYLFDRFYPFDGLCSCSFGADVELRFPDGQSLHAHSGILSLASPVLRQLIRFDGQTLIEIDGSKYVWRVILNWLNPVGGVNLFASRHQLSDDPLTVVRAPIDA